MDQRYSAPSHFMPMPELISDEPGSYDIIDSNEVRGLPTNGMVDQVNKVMLVPLDAAGRVVSRHECAHVLWTPARMPAVRGSVSYLQAVEDGRINRGLRSIGLGIDLDDDQLALVVKLGVHDLEHEAAGLQQWALRTIASYGTNAEEPLLALVDRNTPRPLPFTRPLPPPLSQRVLDIVTRTHDKLERARKREGGPVANPKSARLIARWLRRELLMLGLPEPKRRGGLACCLGAGPGTPGRGSSGRLARDLLNGTGGGAQPGRMRISEPRRPYACAAPHRGASRARRAATEGTMLRDIWRYAHDQRVFTTPVAHRYGGGSVLIDTSGSMSLDGDDIAAIIAGAPGATLVAIYSGHGTEGELRIVVRDGRRVGVEGLTPFGSANVVDQPALEWLAKQPEPRVWISDGSVTGCNDRASGDIKRRCKSICRRASIQRVGDAAAAAKLLVGRR